MEPKRVLVTGGAGFIGSTLVRFLLRQTATEVLVVDSLTYAGNRHSFREIEGEERWRLAEVDICDPDSLRKIFQEWQPDTVMHLAAESHVDRSIDGPAAFIETNIVGTFNLLTAAREYWETLSTGARSEFRFVHVSTDEVYGTLGKEGLFTETTPYDPRSPYSASKASSDHLARAWWHTYGLPVVVTNCSNNYGPYQFPEKLIPLTILNAWDLKEIPIYGKGDQVRDWLHVEDHVEALWVVRQRGVCGETYNIGGRNEQQNLEVVRQICETLDRRVPQDESQTSRFESLVKFVTDRPGHDARYAIDNSKISRELGWQPKRTFPEGLDQTVAWYLESDWWWRPLRERVYSGERLGTGSTQKT